MKNRNSTNPSGRDEITRREFLTASVATMAGVALAAAPSAASARASRGIILGTGDHRYEAIHDWLTPPDHIRFGDTHGVAQDSRGRIYVGHTVHPTSPSKDAIAVFDENGVFITSWGARFEGGSHGLDLRREGDHEFLYHCDIKNRQVVKTSLTGEVVWEKGVPWESDRYVTNTPYIPTNVAFAPNGDFYVTDGYGSDWIHQYTQAGRYIRTFGGKGANPGQVSNPHGLWVDNRGAEPFLVVADRANSRLQYFTLDGRHVRFVSDGMRQPCHLDIRDGMMLVPDLKSVVTLLDEKNRVVVQLGDGDPSNLRGASREQFIPGKFIHPHDAMFLRNGDILVSEWVPIGRITLLRKLG